MNAVRAMVAARRVVAAAPLSSPIRVQAATRRAMSGGHDAHHPHMTFELPYNPWGAPFFVASFVVFGGLGTIYTAIQVQQAKWTPPK